VKILSVLLAVFLALPLMSEQGSPDVIHFESREQEEKTEETGHVEVFTQKTSGEAITFAERAAEPGKRFIWTPSPDPGRSAGGARIPGAVLSSDGSAVIMLETVGAPDGPFDTRLAVISVNGEGAVQVMRFPKARFTKILQAGDETLLLAAPGAENTRILRLDLCRKKILRIVTVPAFSDWLIRENQLLLKDRDSRSLRVLNIPDLTPEGSPKKLRGKGGLLIAGPGETLYNLVLEPKPGVEVIRPAGDSTADPDERFLPLPRGFRPASGVRCKNAAVWMEPGGAAHLQTGREFHLLSPRVTGVAAGNHTSGKLYLGLLKKDMIVEYEPEQSIRPLQTMEPGRLSPKTRGEVLRIFTLPDKDPALLILDHRANLYRLTPPKRGKNWKKTIVFTPGG